MQKAKVQIEKCKIEGIYLNGISSKELQVLVDEANELSKIVAKSVITAKGEGK